MDNHILSALKAIDVSTLSRADWISVGMALKEEAIPAPYGTTGPETTAVIIPANANASGTAFTAPAHLLRAAPSFRWQRIAAGLPSAARTAA